MRADETGAVLACPDADSLRAYATRAAAPSREIEAHVLSCDRCARETLLAAAFDGANLAPPPDAEDLAHVRAASARTLEKLARPPRRRGTTVVAALMGLGVAAAVFLVLERPAFLPTPGESTSDSSPFRGIEIQLSAPTLRPVELAWSAAPGAARYALTVAADTGEVVVAVETVTTSWRATNAEAAALTAPGRYSWRVEARDSAGERIAESDWGAFTIEVPR